MAGVLGFSMRTVLIKLCYAEAPVSPTTLIFLRMVLSLPVFLATAWWLRRQQPALTARDWGAIFGLGMVGYYAASYLDFIGLQWIGAGVGRLIQFLYPTLVLSANTEEESRLFLLGAALVFGSGLCYAVYLVASSRMVQRIGSMRFTAYTMCVSTAPVVLQFLLLEPLSSLDQPPVIYAYAAIMAIFATALPVFFVAEALKRIGANHFALVGAVGPVSVAVTSALGLDEPLTLLQVLGGVLVIFGVLLVSLKPKRS